MNRWPNYTDQEINKVIKVLKSGNVNYLSNNEGRKFEKEFSKLFGSKYSIALSNGTNALELSLMAINLNTDDEVIVTSKSFIASASAVVAMGGKPIFSDIDINSQNISSNFVEKLMTKQTRALICVHLGGWPCNVVELLRLCRKYGIKLIEDCSQAHGAKFKNRYVGTFGDFGTWSFCNDKIISTGGEGGMITTNSYKNYKLLWSLKDHGKNKEKYYLTNKNNAFKFVHDKFGTNYRLTEMQSAIGRVQLKTLKARLKIRNRNANRYMKNLSKLKVLIIPNIPKEINHSFYRLYLRFNFKYIKKGWSKNRILYNLNKQGFLCSEGSCSEIYRENCFINSIYRVKKRLPNARILSLTSFALLVDHTISINQIDINSKIAINFLNEISI